MDVQVDGKPRLHYKLNGCQSSKDEGLQFLSVEEKECILFFEETIDSLEEGFDDTTGLTSRRTNPAEGLQTSSNSQSSPAFPANVSPSLMEHDIIDLVHSPTNFTMPDFQKLAVTPESHYENIPKKDPVESVVPSSTASFDAHEDNNHQPPPGSVPTPVVIASKIAEHQGTGGITPSTLLGHRRSLESKREPPMPARNPHLPSKISMTRGSRDISPHSLATAVVNLQERRSQMLANLPAGSHPLEGGEPACMRNLPMRSVSFKDMEPEKSRMEALSKLGLTGGKTASFVSKGSSSTTLPNSSAYKVSSSATSPINGPNKLNISANSPTTSLNKASSSANSPTTSLNKVNISANSPTNSLNKASSSASSPISSPIKVNISANSPNSSFNKASSSATSPISSPNKVSISAYSASNSANKVSGNTQAHTSNYMNTSNSILASSNSHEPKPRGEISSNSFNYYGGKSAAITPMAKETALAVSQDRRSSIPPSSAEVKQTDFNSYGGKSIILNPSKSVKSESGSSLSANTSEEAETHFNSYGGRSKVIKVINPSVNTDVPEEVNFAHSHLPNNTVAPTMHHSNPSRSSHPADQTGYDAKPKVPTPVQPDPVHQPIVRTRPATLPPPTAPRPHCPSGSLRPRPDPVPSEILSKPAPSFRAQGITVKFSGKGTTEESRRDALRRLGLLKHTS